jgi:hypothetical protein
MLRRGALLAVFWALVPARADACMCAPKQPCDGFWTAEVVFIGRAESVTNRGGDQVSRFVVQEWLRGERPVGDITIHSRGVGGSCDYDFKHSVRYLVHGSRRPDGTWSAFICGGTLPLDQATDALRYIREALANPGAGGVSGTAFQARSSRMVADARVFLRTPQRELVARTDAEGRFAFTAVPPGEYTLVLETPPGLGSAVPQRVGVGKNSCATVYVQVSPLPRQ